MLLLALAGWRPPSGLVINVHKTGGDPFYKREVTINASFVRNILRLESGNPSELEQMTTPSPCKSPPTEGQTENETIENKTNSWFWCTEGLLRASHGVNVSRRVRTCSALAGAHFYHALIKTRNTTQNKNEAKPTVC